MQASTVSQGACSSACSGKRVPLRSGSHARIQAISGSRLVRPINARSPNARDSAANAAPLSRRLHVCRNAAVAESQWSASAQTVDVENCVVVGSGPAGYTAAIYAARANLKPVVFEGFTSGRGGQLMGTTEVENFPGFPEGVTGPELMSRMRQQAARWGAELYTEDVEMIDLSTRPFTIRSTDREVKAHTMIIATGATAKRLHLPSEETYWGKGISACAICDGASPLFKKREVAVVGAGDSALEEAVYLTKYCSHVHLLVRSEKMRASKAMQDRLLANKGITVHYNVTVEDAYGGDVLGGLKIVNTATGEKKELNVAGLFYGIGHQPNSKLISGQVELDEAGYVKVKEGVSTNVEGVFAAGDLHDHEWRQAITAAGSGCMAALSVERYLTLNNLGMEFHGVASMEEQEEVMASASEESVDLPAGEEAFDINADVHKGQFALRKLYHESTRPLAVLYTSPSCGPCRSLKPILMKVVEEYAGQLHYCMIDIEADPEIAEAAGVNGTPTFQLFKGGDLIKNLPGVKMKREYRALFDEALKK